ncbi:hypothetical protein KDW54_06640 [Burkholderia ambifaria]|uniref:hypothetical protein n=1 Tax=Burkholderia ambifaria TaxID=152480 RepID=UPI001B972584|nr:hypothetical protein [Burkholderia ambifaria]MBR8182075.1 hypothetical protein [Burkholderia ambifaria]
MKALAVLLLAGLSGCAGTAHYTVSPFYDPELGRMVCCRAEAFSGKDVNSVSFDLAMQPGGAITVHFAESGVGATAPLNAQGAVISNVAAAASNVAVSASKFSLRP